MTTAPRLFANVDPLIKQKFELALANRGQEVNVLVGKGNDEAGAVMMKLAAMRIGLRKYQPEGSELHTLATGGFIKFGKEYDRKAAKGEQFTVYLVVYALADLRPSAAAAQAMADFEKGLRKTPF